MVTGPLCAQVDGFSLHAGVYCRPCERDKLEKLCRYVARPAVAAERLSVQGNGNILYKLKKPYWDGTSHLLFSPQEFMEKLAALVPLPRAHLTRFSGILAPHAKSRKDVVPKAETVPSGKDVDLKEEKPKRKRMTWAKLLKRVFKMDVETCHACGGKMRMIAAILERKVIRQILTHLKLPREIPQVAPVRSPPWEEFEAI